MKKALAANKADVFLSITQSVVWSESLHHSHILCSGLSTQFLKTEANHIFFGAAETYFSKLSTRRVGLVVQQPI